MRRIAPFSACLFAGAVLLVSPPRSEASPLPPAGLQQGMALDDDLHLVRRGFRGGGSRVWRGGGGRAFAFRGGGGRAWRGGRVWRGGPAYAWRGGRVWRGRPVYAWRGGRVWRARPAYAWRSGRRWRGWRGPRWGYALAAPYYYSGCPLVRRRVWTPRGWRIRWVRRCYW